MCTCTQYNNNTSFFLFSSGEIINVCIIYIICKFYILPLRLRGIMALLNTEKNKIKYTYIEHFFSPCLLKSMLESCNSMTMTSMSVVIYRIYYIYRHICECHKQGWHEWKKHQLRHEPTFLEFLIFTGKEFTKPT